MAIITITTPFNIDLEFKVADFGKRVLAWLIDVVVICTYYYIVQNFILKPIGVNARESTVAYLLILILPVMAYQLCFEIFFNGQTPGKKAVGIKIIDIEGKEPSWGQYIIRWILGLGNYVIYSMPLLIIINPLFIILLMFFYIPDVIVIAVSRKLQRIGDLAAGTVLIDANYKPDINQTIYKEIEVSNYTPLFPQVMRLTDRDINGIRNLLNVKSKGRDNIEYMQKVEYKIKEVLKIESHIEGYDFLQQLLYDYNFLSGNK